MVQPLDVRNKEAKGEISRPLEYVQKVTKLQMIRLALGLTHRQMAARVANSCAAASTLKERTNMDYEQRLVDDPLEGYQAGYCACFGVDSIAILGLGIWPEAARNWTWMTPEDIVKEKYHRREALRRLGITGVAGAAGMLLPVPHLVADGQDLEASRSISQADVDHAQEHATKLAIAYRTAPDAGAAWAAKAHAYTLLDILRSGRAKMGLEVKLRLTSVASDAASLAGYGDMNAGQHEAADRWFSSSLQLARDAGDRRLEGLALAASAWIPWSRPEQDRTAVLAALQAAAGFQSVLRPRGRAYVFSYLSRELAANGEDLSSGRFLEEARYAAGLVPLDEPGWGWWSEHGELGGWDGTRPQSFTASRLLRLGRPAEALDLYEEARSGFTLPVRRIGLHANVMNACVALGDVERACESGIAALDESKAHGLVIWPEKFRASRRGFPAGADALPLVRELDERLALAS
ncbi:MAG: hypothetical protein ACRDZO_07710 [Egibacteraceae bacterium]